MMPTVAAFRIERPDLFPDGTTVKAYKFTGALPASGTPRGAVAAEATVSAGVAELTGLTAGTEYVAYASVASNDRYLQIASAVVAEGASISASQKGAASGVAELDARGNVQTANVGTQNIGIGTGAIYASANPAKLRQNIAIGHEAMTLATGGDRNIAIGRVALARVTGELFPTEGELGTFNVAIGEACMQFLTTGFSNTGIGSACFEKLTTGNHNFALGESALALLTTGSENIAIGGQAMKGAAEHAVSATIAIGHKALRNITTGTANTAIGHKAGEAIESGSSNTALGNGALSTNKASNGNTAVGLAALATATAAANTALGASAGEATTTGEQNTFAGSNAGKAFTTGSKNAALGRDAGSTDGTTATTNSVSNTTLLGFQAQATIGKVIVLGSAIEANRQSMILGGVGSEANLGKGVGVFSITNAVTNPTANYATGGVLYASAGALFWRGSGGTVTEVAKA